jgi:pantoate--beta-alanine ligase
MEIYKTIFEIGDFVKKAKSENKCIGFVPTMGALHKGHLSLLNESKNKTDLSIVSIFVNPTQFNNQQDYIKYPRFFDKDLELLKSSGCDVVFLPSEEEMYPEPDNRIFELGYLEGIMEGKFRPGHFQGVVKIVSKLFNIVSPDFAFFGQKDFQQLAIVKKLVQLMNSSVKIISCPIVREDNGLAMSSRNQRLSDEEFSQASIIYKTISRIPEMISTQDLSIIKKYVKENIDTNPLFQTEYVEIVDSESLKVVENIKNHASITCCVAVFCGQVRLIDNVQINL